MKLSEVKAGQKFMRLDTPIDIFTKLHSNGGLVTIGVYEKKIVPYLYYGQNNVFYGDDKDVEVKLVEEVKIVKPLMLSDLKPTQKFRLKDGQVVNQNLILLETVSSESKLTHSLLGKMNYLYCGEKNGLLYGTREDVEVVLV